MNEGSTPPEAHDSHRFAPLAFFFLVAVVLFVGGSAAALYRLFSEYAGVRNVWLLICGAPFGLAVLGLIAVVTLYLRYGRPLELLFNAIDTVEDGDLSVRVPEGRSDMFSDLFRRFNRMVGELERAEQQRRNLTADIAHELRTPLHILQGNLEGILDGVYQPTPEHINSTLDETRLLSRLVNDLQALSLAESGQLPLHLVRFRVADLMADLTLSFSAQARQLSLRLETHAAGPEMEVFGDYDRLNQVLSNLVSNAFAHTPAGGSVAIQAEPRSGATPGVRITVRDTGSGIPADSLPFVFDRFWRGDRARTGRSHSGLGLAIARQLVLAHGGRIEVQSDGLPGRGTVFTIELPQGRAVGS